MCGRMRLQHLKSSPRHKNWLCTGGCTEERSCDNDSMKYFTRFAVVAALIMFPVVTSAATSAELQAQAQALLQQVAALQAQLAAQNGVTTSGTVSSSVAASGANCPLIGRVLKLGSSGDDVTRLQKFLSGDLSVYPEAQVTGYYGTLTEAAVKRWQVKYNIVSSGTAESTGYGVTGPRTAAAISLQCSISGGSGSGPVGGFMQVSPVTGAAPLTVNVKATINTGGSCTGGTYTLAWGRRKSCCDTLCAHRLMRADRAELCTSIYLWRHLYRDALRGLASVERHSRDIRSRSTVDHSRHTTLYLGVIIGSGWQRAARRYDDQFHGAASAPFRPIARSCSISIHPTGRKLRRMMSLRFPRRCRDQCSGQYRRASELVPRSIRAVSVA